MKIIAILYKGLEHPGYFGMGAEVSWNQSPAYTKGQTVQDWRN